jgi:hypothetical protein
MMVYGGYNSPGVMLDMIRKLFCNEIRIILINPNDDTSTLGEQAEFDEFSETADHAKRPATFLYDASEK